MKEANSGWAFTSASPWSTGLLGKIQVRSAHGPSSSSTMSGEPSGRLHGSIAYTQPLRQMDQVMWSKGVTEITTTLSQEAPT